MPDQYGNRTEAEMRGQTSDAPNTLSGSQPNLIFSGNVGGNPVQLYGNGPQLSYEQAVAYMRSQSQQQMQNGSMTVAQWQALNPGASADDLKAYKRLNQTYHDSTSGQGLGDRIGNAVNFELDRAGHLIKGVANNPGQLLTGGIDPIGTKIGNTITGSNNEALVGQLGGATENDYKRYEDKNGFGSLGAARSGTTAANYISGMFGGIGAAHGIGQAVNSFTGSGVPTQTYHGGANLNYSASPAGGAASAGADSALPEIVVNGTRAGLSTGQIAGIGAGAVGAGSLLSGWGNTSNPVGSFGSSQTGGNAGQLANSGGISGGAGTGGTTQGALGNASGVANQVSGAGGNMAGGFGSSNGGLWGNLAQLGGSLFNTWQQQQGAKDASRASVKGDAAAIAEQRRQFDLARGDQMPWLQAGTAALGRLQDPATNFTASPGYAFTRAEGTRDIGNSFAARGGALSGNALRGLDAYNTGLASNEYNNWWNQQAGLAGVGQTSAQSLGGLGQNSANNVSNLLSNQGNARASGIVDQTNAVTNGVNDVANWYGNWLRNRQYGGS